MKITDSFLCSELKERLGISTLWLKKTSHLYNLL